jgi:hypothetical protein
MIETTPRSKGNEIVARARDTRGQAALQGSGPLEWLYRLTAPAEPPTTAPLVKREAARKGRLASTTLLFMSVVTVLPIPVALITNNVPLLVALIVTLLINAVALFLNRLGKLVAAGVLFVTVLNVGFMLSLLTTPGGLDMSNLPTFDLLAEALLVSVAFFPPWSIFVVLLVNSVFILLDLALQPHTLALGHYLTVNAYDVLVRPIILQIIVAGVTYLWVRSATEAIVRADRAEEIAELEHRELNRQEQEIEHKRQLDLGIQKILETHVEIAKGNFKARAPLAQDNILWRIAYSLNNLLARLQRYSQLESEHQRLKAEYERLLGMLRDAPATAIAAERELQRTREAVVLLLEAAQKAKNGQGLLWIPRTGTVVDALAQELAPFQPQAQRPVSQQRLD